MNAIESVLSFMNWSGSIGTPAELPDIFPFPMGKEEFINSDSITIFSKILTDTLERTHGLSDKQIQVCWDNCLKSESNEGLITMLSKAMVRRQELFIIYDKALNVVREADPKEREQIRSDYSSSAGSKIGIYLSFKNFIKADMVKLYVALEYCTVSSLYKTMNVSKAVQLKFSDLRASVNSIDSQSVINQAVGIADAMKAGRDFMLDAKDIIEMAKPDLTAINQGIDFISAKLSFYLGMPASYVTGIQTAGMGSTGEQDKNAIERGLRLYFYSIIKPTFEALFGDNLRLSYKSQDFRNMTTALEALKTFNLTDEEFVSKENKTKLINILLDLPEDAEGDQGQTPIVRPTPVLNS